MDIQDVTGNLFTAPDGYIKAHCISADCRMGAGIATEFVARYPRMRPALLSCKPSVGDCISYWDVMNLITKRHFHQKPTRDDFNKTINKLRKKMELLGYDKLALPRLGSGLDKLDWEESRSHIEKTFEDMEISILFYKQ